ncbi:Zinc finger, PHD-type [Corchorus olitorius]|uniref:Zinc finger, PHD-type n=1 Tax=Corchorus olitorius TaxID=93759 RepID=A0A1R3J616_9ROSI|nr:Zinc finger, PHD-type [Corchorus olitorius]
MEPKVPRPRGRPRKRRRPEEENESAAGDLKSDNSKTKKRAFLTRSVALVGRYVLKEFGGNVYLGKIVSYDTGLYRVDYEDGDFEDLESGELRELILEESYIDDDLSRRKVKLDELVLRRIAKKESELEKEKKKVEALKNEINGVETSALSELSGGMTVENDGEQLEDDADSSSDSCEHARDRDLSLEDEVPLIPPPVLPSSSGTIGVPEECVSHLFSVYGFLRCLDWSLLDALTWPVYLVQYFMVMGYARGPEWKGFYEDVTQREYYSLSVSRKLMILQFLCDDALEYAEVRAEIDTREATEVGTDPDVAVVDPPEKGPRRVHPRYSKTSACKEREAMEIIAEGHEVKSSSRTFSLGYRSAEGNAGVDADVDRNSDECRLCGMDGTLLCCDGLNASLDTESYLRYYNLNDIPKVLQVLTSSIEHKSLYVELCKAIIHYWSIPENILSPLEMGGIIANIKEDARVSIRSPLPSANRSHKSLDSVDAEHASSFSRSNVGASYPDTSAMNQNYLLGSVCNGGTVGGKVHPPTDKKLSEQSCIESAMSAASVSQQATSDVTHQSVVDRSTVIDHNSCASGNSSDSYGGPANGIYFQTNMICQSKASNHVGFGRDAKSSTMDYAYMGTSFKPNAYVNHYIQGHFAASAAAKLSVLSSEESQVSEANKSGSARKVTSTSNIFLQLEENISIIALSVDWIKLADDWLVESVVQSNSSTAGLPQKRGSVGRRRKKQSVASEVTADDNDDKSFDWWRGGKLSTHVFQKAILPGAMVRKAARQGGVRRISALNYVDDYEIPKRSRQLIWRAAVERSKNTTQLALQVRYLDLHVRWNDLVRPEHNIPDGKGTETEASVFRNAMICDKKIVENKTQNAVTCGTCQGYCHQDCTLSSMHMNGKVECMIICKQCYHAKILAENKISAKSPTTPLSLQGRDSHSALAVSKGMQVMNSAQSIKPLGSIKSKENSVRSQERNSNTKQTASLSGMATKRTKLCNWGVIWRKKHSDEIGIDFRRANILGRGGSDNHLLRPICQLCEKPYNSDLMYIHCETCKKWYHAEAVELDESRISDLVGFKCCKCRRIRGPECPYMDPELKEQKRKKQSSKPQKQGQGSVAMDSGFGITSFKECKPITPIVSKEDELVQDNDPLLFSLSKVELITDNNKSDVDVEWNSASCPSLKKLPVRRHVKQEVEMDGPAGGDFGHVELPACPEPNNHVEPKVEPSVPLAEWDISGNGLEGELLFDYDSLNYEDMEFEPQTYFSFTELLASDDGGPVEANDTMGDGSGQCENASGSVPQDGVPEQCGVNFSNQGEPIIYDNSDVNAAAHCHVCLQNDPAPELYCDICGFLMHGHCSPWEEPSSSEDSWRCGRCREWR